MSARSFEEREERDIAAVEEVMRAAEKVAKKSPELVEITTENGEKIIRIETGEPGVHERKEHQPGTCLEPGRD